MRIATIIETPSFRVVSHGNGHAYQFINKLEGAEVFFQGDDALSFETLIDEDQSELSEIWDDYSELAQRLAD